MKTCECGGMLYRHGTNRSKHIEDGQRYRCKECGKCITVRNGKVVTHNGRIKLDWRLSE